MKMSKTIIWTENLVKKFKTNKSETIAVNQLSLQINSGEAYGLIGPDGAGKTTAIRVILGLLTRTSGESSVSGFDPMRNIYEIRERIGYIAQSNVLPAELTVMENMRLFAGVHGVSPIRQKKRIPELLSFAGLSEFTDRLAGRLSGGMKKKLALACSLIHEPDVVFLDEPTLGVDPVSRREFWTLLSNLRAEKGLTIFMSTPYMDEADRCTQVGMLANGQLIASGSPAEIKSLVKGALLEVTVSRFKDAFRTCSMLPGILEVQTYGQKLHVFVDDISLRKKQIETAFANQNIQHAELREIEVSMEEAYISLVNKQSVPLYKS
jgi:ABC-2 type transport system ATP-binding protein